MRQQVPLPFFLLPDISVAWPLKIQKRVVRECLFSEFQNWTKQLFSQSGLFLSTVVQPLGLNKESMDIDKQIIDDFEEKVVNHPEVRFNSGIHLLGIS